MNTILKSELHKIKDMVSQNFKYEENKWIYCKLKAYTNHFKYKSNTKFEYRI